jgi:hypothetical protein
MIGEFLEILEYLPFPFKITSLREMEGRIYSISMRSNWLSFNINQYRALFGVKALPWLKGGR